MRQPCRTLRRFSAASAGGTSPQSPEAWRSRSSPGSCPAITRAFSAPGVATTRPRGKSGAAILGPPRVDGRKCFFNLRGSDLLPAPPCKQHEPARPVEGEGFKATEPAPPDKVAGGRVRGAVLFVFDLDRGAFDKRGEVLAGDVWIHLIAERFFPLEPRLQVLWLKTGTVAPIVNL